MVPTGANTKELPIFPVSSQAQKILNPQKISIVFLLKAY